MPSWAGFAPCVLVIVVGLAIILFGEIDKHGKNRKGSELKAPAVEGDRFRGVLDQGPR